MCHCLQSTEYSHKLCLSVANIQVSVNERSTKMLWICVTGVSFFFFFKIDWYACYVPCPDPHCSILRVKA